jgi:prepilin-type processing-associated H-X9-DG protein
MQCSNQAKQVALSLHSFIDINSGRIPNNGQDALFMDMHPAGGPAQNGDCCGPSGAIGTRYDGVDRYSAFTSLLPFIEQTALHSRIMGYISSAVYPISGGWEANIASGHSASGTTMVDGLTNPFCTVIPYFLCPSDGNILRKEKSGKHGQTNYHFCRGDYMIGDNWGENNTLRGIARQGRFGEVSLSSLTDGTSNTMFISECVADEPHGQTRMYKRGVAADVDIHGKPAINCLNVRGSNGQFTGTTNVYTGNGKGNRWSDSRTIMTGFHAALPPNSPSCIKNTDDSDCSAISASSSHSGGVTVGMCDGSIKFVSETVDCGRIDLVLGAPDNTGEGHQWKGASTHGVWGAMATPQGNESKSL